MLKKHSTLVLLGIFIIVALLLRFINVPARYTFDGDAVTDAVVAYKSVQEVQLPITGNFSAAGAFTFGPWYFYHLMLFYAITHLPASVWILNGLLSVLTVVLLFYFGKEIKDEKLGLIMAALGAITPAQNAIGSSSSNTNIVAFYATIVFWGLVKTVQKKETSLWWAFGIGLSIGIAINAHYQALLLLIIPFYLLFFSADKRIHRFLFSWLGIGLTFIPLLFFNLTNHWHTVRNFIYYALHGRGLIYIPNSWTIYLRDFWPETVREFFGVPLWLAVSLIGFITLTILYAAYKRKFTRSFWLCGIFFLLSFVYLRYYWGERHTVYLYYLQPLLYLFTGYALYLFLATRKLVIISVALLLCLTYYGLRQDMNYMTTKNYAGYMHQVDMIKNRYPNQTAAIYLCNELHYDQAIALGYLLDRQGLHTAHPQVKLAMREGNCPLPRNNQTLGYNEASQEAALQKLYTIQEPFAGYNFSTASESAIREAGWKPVLIDEVYEGEARWYFKERP